MFILNLSLNVTRFLFSIFLQEGQLRGFNFLPWFFILLLILILFLFLAYWLKAEREPPEPDYPVREFFIPGEIIVRGPMANVDAAVAAVSQTIPLNRARGDRIQFGDLPPEVGDCFGACYGFTPENFVIDRYTFEVNVDDVAAVIRAINNMVGPGSDVQIDPNWLLGPEWRTAGSGWEPWDPEGSDDGTIYPAEEEFFMKQWAFQQIGLTSRDDIYCGENVKIGIFDTWPSDKDGRPSDPGSLAGFDAPFPLNVENIKTDYKLHEDSSSPADVSYHGYFVAGLAQAVARNAKIDIYRVLNKDNLGDLFSLIQAIYDFVLLYAPKIQDKSLSGAVINLSLGIRLLPEDSGIHLPLEVQTLRDILRAARCAGMVIVAAAGNRGENVASPAPADLPANWSEIIGVGSSNKGMSRSCFSNLGNVAAPGGDGRAEKQDGQEICVPANESCTDPECPFSVIGPYQKSGTDEKKYGFWSGTSFSTPMVAGLAACVIEKGQGLYSPDKVREMIECGVTKVPDEGVGVGIINKPKTLACVDQRDPNQSSKEQSGYEEDSKEAAASG